MNPAASANLNRTGRKLGVPNKNKAVSARVHPLVRELLSHGAATSDTVWATRAGFVQTNFSAIRRGAHTPSLRTFIALANALDLEVVLIPKEPKA